MIHYATGFIKNLKSAEYQTGTQNGNMQGSNIVSTQKIGEGKYEAENQICLLPGFEATAKDKFSAEIKTNSKTYQWQYALSDHLGNLRVIFTDKNNDGLIRQSFDDNLNEVLSVRNYSPFGLELGGSHQNLKQQFDFKFNGKQDNGFSGLTDFGARYLDKALAVWMQVDPMAEKGRRWSPYTYAFDNPIRFIDPDGMWPSPPIIGGPTLLYAMNKAKDYAIYKMASVFKAESEARFIQKHSIVTTTVLAAKVKMSQMLANSVTNDNNINNSFRHVEGQATVASSLGQKIAKEAGDAHEGKYNLQNELKDNAASVSELSKKGSVTISNQIADSFVDQLNNQVGRDIAKANPDASDKDLAIKSLDALRDGKAYFYNVGKDGETATVIRSSLKHNQYNQILKKLNE